MHDLVEVMEKAKDVKALKEKIFECFKSEISTKGFECMSAEEAGEVVDMIKDLAETERNCMEALYYQKVIEAMVSYDEPRYNESANMMGYNRNRYKSSGRYAPSGMGTRMGFMPHTPYLDYDGEMDPRDYMTETMTPKMGYRDNESMGNMGYRSNDSMRDMNSSGSNSDQRYGKAYNDYVTRRRHFTETKSMEDKKEMETHAEEHVKDTIVTIRDIWRDAEPALRKRMKEDLTKLVGEMKD